MATVLLCAGAKGKRYALPNATVHMHQALGGARGQASDIEIAAKEIIRNNEIIRNIIANNTGQSVERVTRDFDRDFYLDAQGAKDYGFVDELLTKPTDAK
jgi:ATP-dependent Clp protease protease subunit